MFKPNNPHNQQDLFDTTYLMNPKTRTKLAKSWAPIFYEHVFSRIDEAPFAAMYDPVMGRPNFPVNVLLSLEYIKHMKDISDEELMEDFSFNYLVNYAVGMRNLGELSLTERTLDNFRVNVYLHCLAQPDGENALFSQFIALAQDFAGKADLSLTEQRTDTMMFSSNIKKAGRMALAHDVLAKAVKALPEGGLTAALAEVMDKGFKNKVLYRSKGQQDSESRLAMLLGLCHEALALFDADPAMAERDEAAMLRRFLAEQSTPDPETGKPIPKPKGEISPASLQSAHDSDATFRRKGDKAQSGYVLGLSETCGRGNPFQVITDCVVEPNNANDADILEGRLPAIRENTGCEDMYADGAFHSEGLRRAAEENGVTIHLTNMSGTAPKKKLPASDYEIDGETSLILRCPAGHAPISAGVGKGWTTAHFGHGACVGCQLFGQCHSKRQKKDFVVRISLKAVEVGRIRADMKADQIENTSKRAAIEGTNSAVKRKGQGKLRVCGLNKCTAVSIYKAAAQNIKRFIKFVQGGYRKKPSGPPPNGIAVPNLA
jgi:hypothetical protein